MFWSKIWFFLITIVAAIALTLALLMPRPAERAAVDATTARLARACSITGILMRDFARTRIQLASDTARAESGLEQVLFQSSKNEIVSGDAYSTTKKILTQLDFGTKRQGDEEVPYRPDLVLALDMPGRVVARSGKDENSYGDSLRGYYLVDDALHGYLRDDLWTRNGQLMLMAGAPVVTKQLDYAGAVIIGEIVDTDFAKDLADRLDVHLTFYAGGEAVAASEPIEIHKEVLARAEKLAGEPPGRDCATIEPFVVSTGAQSYWVALSRLPGEAGQKGAFYAVHVPKEKAIGFMGTINAVKKDDLSFSKFPWIRVGILFLLMVGVGIGLMIWETDRPLRKLSADAVNIAQGDTERLAEEKHRGKYGSIARSVNIAIDKLHRETKAAKKDLDNLLGPAPAGQDTPAASSLPAAPPVGLGGPAPAAPPPSEFRFSGKRPAAAAPTPAPAPGPGPGDFDLGIPAPPGSHTPPPPVTLPPDAKPARPKPPVPAAKPPPPKPPVPRAPTPPPDSDAIHEDILGPAPGGDLDEHEEETRVAPQYPPGQAPGAGPVDDEEEVDYRPIFEQFVKLKKECGESVANLTYDRFLKKIRSNRDALIAKHGCKEVKFQVYEKDGKAALKASPVR